MAALQGLKEDQQKTENIAKAGHELVRRALRPENVRRSDPWLDYILREIICL